MKSVAIDLKHVVHNDLTGQRRVIPRDTRYMQIQLQKIIYLHNKILSSVFYAGNEDFDIIEKIHNQSG